VSSLEPDAPPTGEEVHLPGPTILPLLTAAGIMIAVIGVTVSPILVIGGAVLTIACVARWIMDTRRDIDELPLDHH
jgi:Flp pilus assembly protein TadB